MKSTPSLTRLGLGLSTLLFITTADAGIPLWTIKPINSPKVDVSQTGIASTAHIKYLVTNNSAKIRNLAIMPQRGISQISPCIAGPRGPCILTLVVQGSQLPAGNYVGGPTLCQTNIDGTENTNQCYGPTLADSLKINVIKTVTLQDVAGTYQFNEISSSNNMSSPNVAQAFSSIGQLIFRVDGTGTWQAFSTSLIINGNYNYFDIPSFDFIYTLDPTVNGLATMNFIVPNLGIASTRVSFKMREGTVMGGNMIHINAPSVIASVTSLLDFERIT